MLVEHDLETLPGRWRPGPVFVHDTGSGQVVHEGPPADQVPDLMDEFVEQLDDEDGPAMVRAAMAHLNFVMVHPHKDGNGRLARVIQSLVLAREGLLSPEFCSIEEYLGRFTRDYDDVLAQVGGTMAARARRQPLGPILPGGPPSPGPSPAASHHRDGAPVGYLDGRIAQAELPERVAEALFLAAWGYRVTNEDYRARADVAAGTASRDLRHPVDAGLFEPHGEKRGRHYTATSDLLEQARRVTASLRQEYRLDPYLDEELMVDPSHQLDSRPTSRRTALVPTICAESTTSRLVDDGNSVLVIEHHQAVMPLSTGWSTSARARATRAARSCSPAPRPTWSPTPPP